MTNYVTCPTCGRSNDSSARRAVISGRANFQISYCAPDGAVFVDWSGHYQIRALSICRQTDSGAGRKAERYPASRCRMTDVVRITDMLQEADILDALNEEADYQRDWVIRGSLRRI